MKSIKRIVAFSTLCLLSLAAVHGEDVIMLTTDVSVGEKISIMLNTDSEEASFEGLTGEFVNNEMCEYVVNQPEITIKTSGKLLSINAPACGISQIDLSGATHLVSCKLDENNLNTLNVDVNTALTTLYCQYNQLSSLDVSSLTSLKYLACSYNQLSELNVTQNTDLRELYCYNNQLTALDVSALTRLGKLSCAENQIENLDVSNAGISLTSLFCAGNRIKTLDVSKNSWLTYLGCSENEIGEIDLTKNTDLQIVFLQNNPFNSQIDFSTLKKIEEIYVGNTGQTAINVSNNPKLITLSCSGNSLTALDITANPQIRFLYLQDNQLNGEAMSAIIEALPEMTEARPGQIIVKDADKQDANVCYVSDVEKARNKLWRVGQYSNNQYIDFDGDENTGLSQVQLAAVMCRYAEGCLQIDGATPVTSVNVYDVMGVMVGSGVTDARGSLTLTVPSHMTTVVVMIGNQQALKLRL